jgi:CubicO group peptidase (beta-lactamase class C family)
MKSWIAAAAAAALTITSPAPAQQPEPAAAVAEIFRPWTGAASPGCAVGVAQNGRTVLTRGFGSADLEHNVPITPDTIFEAGSVAKQFTSAAILLLAEEGKLALGDDVRRYVPDLPDYGTPITIDQLMSHTSGLRDWGVVAEIEGWPRTTRAHTNADALAIIARQRRLNYAPGTEYSYTNSGYTLMAVIVERVSGRSLAAFTRERIFQPLGMRSTSWRDDFRRIVPGRAVAYVRSGEGWAQQMPFEDAYGNGGLLTTVGDLLLWNEALSGDRLGASLGRELQQRATVAYGRRIIYARGLVHEPYGRDGEISHGGATAGYRAWLGRWPGERLSVALLCNAGNVDSAATARRVATAFAPFIIPPTAVDAADPAPFVGLWVSLRTGMPLRLEARGRDLAVVGGPALWALHPNRFRGPAGVLSFQSPNLFTLETPEGEEVRFERAQAWTPTPRDIADFAGTYRSDEAAARYEVRAEGGGLVLRNLNRPHLSEPLRPVFQDTFEIKGGIVRFGRHPRNGRVATLVVGLPRVRAMAFTPEQRR